MNDGLSREEATLARWAAEPLTFVQQCLRLKPDPWQAKLLEELPQHDRIAIAGSKGCAKTALESWVIWWTLTTQPDVKIAATSINGNQLRDGLWAELAKWQSRSPLLQSLFHWSPERVTRKTAPGKWFAAARTWNQSADPHTQGQALAGIHGRRVLFVIDEAGGVPPSLLATADAVLATKAAGHQVRVLIGGNTTSVNGALFVAVTKQRAQWHIVRVTSDPDDPYRTPRVSAQWAREQIAMYGRENPWVKINVFAEFPEAAVGKLLSINDCEISAARQIEENPHEPMVLGVDVGTVTDAAIIYPRRGRVLFPPKVLRGASTIVIAAEVVKMAADSGAVAVFVDAGGPGIGVVDQCRALGLSVVPVYFGGAADDATRYANKRTEQHARLADWVREGGKIDGSPELVQDVTEPGITWNVKGQQILEPKDQIKERLGRSPDWGDGASLTFAFPVAAAPVSGDRDTLRTMREQRVQAYDEFGFGG